MTRISLAIGATLLATTALTAPARAQDAAPATGPNGAAAPVAQGPQEPVEISAPGGGAPIDEIVVTGRNIPNAIRATPQVVSVLSSADIARTGEGDIAGALARVTGLSVVDGRFVYVRGLGERYSLALLNGLPLPSPEPLRRVVPLDIFPTGIVSSSVVQKSYSVNYPGEFGGGVINLTTDAVPDESFLEIGGAVSGDTFTTSNLGYTYYGSDLDPLGFDDGTRRAPRGFRQALNSGKQINLGNFELDQLKGYAASLVNAPTTVLQRNNHIPFNGKASLNAGTSFNLGATRIGVIATAGYDNSWRTREAHQQFSVVGDVDQVAAGGKDFIVDITDNHVVVDGLLGIGAEFGANTIRFTNLFIRDTIKQGRLAAGVNSLSNAGIPEIDQNTSWFERQLFDSQLVGEFKFGALSVDVRGTYANAQRKSPYERTFTYFYDDRVGDYVNTLNSNQSGTALISFSDLTDKVYGAGIDLGYKLPTARDFRISAGYAYSDNTRNAVRRDFRYLSAQGALPLTVAQERPDYLISDYNIAQYDIYLSDQSGQGGTAAAYRAKLRVNAGYVQLDASPFPRITMQAGVRYESGEQQLVPVQVTELTPPAATPAIKKDYWLPAGTVTWNFPEDMNLRFSLSKTIARPQFRETANQLYEDTESDRTFLGNPHLTNSKLFNAEARYEWYFGRDQQFTLAGFYKRITKPIEQVAFYNGAGIIVSFLNAPAAELYGGETEVRKYINLDGLDADGFFSRRRLVAIANYTYTQSHLQVGPNDTITYFDGNPTSAASQFTDGAPLTGQSDHVANFEFGLEDRDSLSQQTILLNYASDRVAFRGNVGAPDIIEKPGLTLDFVMRQGIRFGSKQVELKFEARNITGTKHQEVQNTENGELQSNVYKVGTSFSLGASVRF